MSNERYLFTSESVGEGHPDKVCDQISDTILDTCLAQDTESHVACETFTTTGMVLVGGEITTNAILDIEKIAREVTHDIGYTDAAYGLDCNSMAVLNTIHKQSPDINQGVVGKGLKEYSGQQGAGEGCQQLYQRGTGLAELAVGTRRGQNPGADKEARLRDVECPAQPHPSGGRQR